MHLFADIALQTMNNLTSWKQTFPDPSTSPAHYARTLSISCSHPVTEANARAGDWISGFSRVARLTVVGSLELHRALAVTILPFHGFSPIKSLHVNLLVLPSSQVFDLILSFPLLENLSVFSSTETPIHNRDSSNGPPTAAQSPIPPAFSGSLELSMAGGMGPIARRLSSLPGGIHFRKLTLKWAEEEDILLTMALMERCSRTLESLDIACNPRSTTIPFLHLHR